LPGQLIPDHDQPLGFWKGQRPQQYGVHDTENGGVGADAEGEREHHHGREAGILPQLAEGESEVVHGLW
jgi:hypothetical protein